MDMLLRTNFSPHSLISKKLFKGEEGQLYLQFAGYVLSFSTNKLFMSLLFMRIVTLSPI